MDATFKEEYDRLCQDYERFAYVQHEMMYGFKPEVGYSLEKAQPFKLLLEEMKTAGFKFAGGRNCENRRRCMCDTTKYYALRFSKDGKEFRYFQATECGDKNHTVLISDEKTAEDVCSDRGQQCCPDGSHGFCSNRTLIQGEHELSDKDWNVDF